jgi:hypothetical protein
MNKKRCLITAVMNEVIAGRVCKLNVVPQTELKCLILVLAMVSREVSGSFHNVDKSLEIIHM